jgi:hypothetical protein
MDTRTGKQSTYFAEIIESSLQSWRAQSWQWDVFPPFGSLIAIESKTKIIFGIVHQIETGSMDPGRYPFAYQKTEEELLREQPQIFEFLRTSFVCLTLGYQALDHQTGQNNPQIFFYQLAPEPPKIHAFARPATPEEQKTFFANNQYLHVLFNHTNSIVNLDELLLALLEQQTVHASINSNEINEFITTFSLLTGNDYRRLKIFLQRAEPIIKRVESVV